MVFQLVMEKSCPTSRKAAILAHSQAYAGARAEFRKRASFFHREDEAYLRFLIPEGVRVLDIGCGIGDTLAALKPSHGVGVDFSPALIDIARKMHPELQFHVLDAENPAVVAEIGETFDYILVHDTVGSFDDCQKFFEHARDAARGWLFFPPLAARVEARRALETPCALSRAECSGSI
jgi:SAM-dependent methyltransferase